MYAVISDRGNQFKAAPGERLTLDRLDQEVGATVEVPVLLTADGDAIRIGQPEVAGAKATLKVIAHQRGPKLLVGTFKRRKDSRRRIGHRSEQTVVEVVSID